jgi:hypothetical protein
MYPTSMVRLLLSTGAGEGNGGGGGEAPKPDPSLSKRMKEHGGNAAALAGQLYQQVNHLQAENTRLKGLIPPDGAVVLAGDDVAAWNEYRAIGKPKEIRDGLTERDTLRTDNARHAREKAIADAGYDASTLGPLLPADAVVEMIDGPKGADGKPSKVLGVKPAGAEKASPMAEYIDQHLPKFKAVVGGPKSSTSDPEAPRVFRGIPQPPADRRPAPQPGGDQLDPVQAARVEIARTGRMSW